MSSGDIRYGESPFPYGPNYDLGIDMVRVVGVADDPRGLTEDVSYIKMTLYGGYGLPEMYTSDPVSHRREIYIRETLLDGFIELRIGDVGHVPARGYMHGTIVGVNGRSGLIGYFAWYGGVVSVVGAVPPVVFDDILSSKDMEDYSVDGPDVRHAATQGAPLYYFTWSKDDGRVSSPIRRVLDVGRKGTTAPSGRLVAGVFVPVVGDTLGAPIPAVYVGGGSLPPCSGDVKVKDVGWGTPTKNPSLKVGELSASDKYEWYPEAGITLDAGEHALHATAFSYSDTFSSLLEGDPAPMGYFCVGSYDENVPILEQNGAPIYIGTPEDQARVMLLDDHVDFPASDGEDELFLVLSPEIGAPPSPSAEVVFSLTNKVPEAQAGMTYSKIANVSVQGGVYRVVFNVVGGMYVTISRQLVVQYNDLPNGSLERAIIVWNPASGEWLVDRYPLPDGTKDKQVLTWDAVLQGGMWVPDRAPGVPDGEEEGDMLVWRKEDGDGEWVPEEAPLLPDGENMDTLFFDEDESEEEEDGKWTANSTMQWDKKNSNVVLDFSELDNIQSDKQMPGVVMKHPAGGSCGLVANIESGSSAGARMDMGWGGDKGGNFELYANSHPTRAGQFRTIYGPDGHIEWKNFRGGSTWKTTAGVTKEGRLFCGFNDTGFPGGNETHGQYDAPKHPLQVFDEEDNDSGVVAGVSKQGRAFFGSAGEVPATVQHPIEVYNEESGQDRERVAYIGKNGRIYTTAEVDSTTHSARVDCNDISFSDNDDKKPLEIKLREVYVMVMGVGGKLEAKKTMMLCSAPYGDAEEVAGGHFDLRYDFNTKQLQKQTEPDGGWTMITGGQFVEETV